MTTLELLKNGAATFGYNDIETEPITIILEEVTGN